MKTKMSTFDLSRIYQRQNPIYLALTPFFTSVFRNDCDVCSLTDLKARYVLSADRVCERGLQMVGQGHSEFVLLIGHTGSGKTTSLRYVYQLGESTPYVSNEGTLIIPILFDDNGDREYGSVELSEINDILVRQIYAANMTIMDKVRAEGKGNFCKDDYDRRFIEFIRTIDRGALKGCEDCGLDDYKQISKNFEECNGFNYLLYYLKFLLTIPEKTVNGVLFVVDGIEMLGLVNQSNIIEEFKKHQNKILRGSYDHCFASVVIAVRPYVVRLFNAKHRPKATVFTQPPIRKEPVKMEAVLEKLHDSSLWKSNDTTEHTYSLSLRVARRMSGKMQDYILQLSNYDHRRERIMYWNVLSNTEYVYRGRATIDPANYAKDIAGITEDDFVIESTTVLRAIGCGDNLVYKDTGNPELAIVNILANSKDSDDEDFMGLLILKYFSVHCNMEDIYGESVYVNRKKLIDDLRRLYPTIGDQNMESLLLVLDSFLKRKIIFPAYNDQENSETNEPVGEKLVLSPRGWAHWNLFSENILLFEMLTEDTWNNFDAIKPRGRMAWSDSIYRCLTYLDHLFQLEQQWINNREDSYYRDVFGIEMISEHILNGIANSLKNIKKSEVDKKDLHDMLSSLYQRIIEYKKTVKW